MTKISDIRDALTTIAGTALGDTYRRIPNPYFAEANADILLEKGYGIGVGPSQRVDLETCKMAFERLFNVVLVKRVIANDHDVDRRDDLENELLEDMQKVRQAIEADHTISGNAVRTDYASDSGISFLLGNNFRYFTLAITVSVLYSETYS